mgnify:CR=1 FL=1
MVGVMGKYGVPGRNVSIEILLELCSELELVMAIPILERRELISLHDKGSIMEGW